jgi:hypothetical protein
MKRATSLDKWPKREYAHLSRWPEWHLEDEKEG